MAILNALYRFLKDQGAVDRNPWCGVARPKQQGGDFDVGRSLTQQHWRAVQVALQDLIQDTSISCGPRARQLAWSIEFLYWTGLRLSELTSARVCDLQWLTLDETTRGSGSIVGDASAGPVSRGAWTLQVVGKGGVRRRVPVPTELVSALEELIVAGLPPGANADPKVHPIRPLLVTWRREGINRWRAAEPLGDQGLYRQIRRFLGATSQRLCDQGEHDQAEALARASTHWLRHTFGTHAVSAGVTLDVVRVAMGHASLTTTSGYLRPEVHRRVSMIDQRFFAKSGPSALSKPGHDNDSSASGLGRDLDGAI